MTDTIESWIDAKSKLDFYKKLETKLRKELVSENFPTAGEGTTNLMVGEYQLKATIKMNRTLDIKELEIMEDILSKKEKACIKRTPTLSLSAYKKLEDHERGILDECITTKPAMPTLSVELYEEFE